MGNADEGTWPVDVVLGAEMELETCPHRYLLLVSGEAAPESWS